jgi:DNA invertase Pin-like site-specific DNA recombinase
MACRRACCDNGGVDVAQTNGRPHKGGWKKVLDFQVQTVSHDGSYATETVTVAAGVATERAKRHTSRMSIQVLREIGYARVSKDEQDTALQVAALRGAGCELIFTENMTGTRRQRPALDAMVSQLRPGDRVNVWKVDRLGRSTVNTLTFVQDLLARDIAFRALTQDFDTSTPTGRLMMGMLMIFSEFERDTIVERTKAGLAAAAAAGAIGGRRRALQSGQVARAREAYTNRPTSPRTGRPMTCKELAELFGVSRWTFMRWADPTYFHRDTSDARQFRARHDDIDAWLASTDDPHYGRSLKKRTN